MDATRKKVQSPAGHNLDSQSLGNIDFQGLPLHDRLTLLR